MPNEFDFPCPAAAAPPRKFFAGDLLFFYGRDNDSRVIEFFTRGPSHVAMVFTYCRTPFLVESTTLCDLPCAIRKVPVRGVQCHGIEQRVANYNGRVYHAPIRWGRRFRSTQSSELTQLIYQEFFSGPDPVPYDLAGAIESPTLLPFFRYPDLGSQFCSSLCATLLQDFGKLNNEDPKRITPAGLLRRVRRQATHEPLVPLKE